MSEINKQSFSLEDLIDSYLNNETICSNQIFSLNEFNNIESANRKLIINNKFEFWVHDEVLIENSLFFLTILKYNSNNNDVLAIDNKYYENLDNLEIKTTKLFNIPYENLIFDILIWMYSKNSKKLKQFSKKFGIFLNLISLGEFFKLKKEYFYIFFEDIKFEWKKDLFSNYLWSKTNFNFSTLKIIVNKMNISNYLKIYCLLSWLKEINPKTNEIIKDEEKINEILKSKDLFLIRNYIKLNKLMIQNIKTEELIQLKNEFQEYISAFDCNGILNNYIFSEKNLKCIVCKNVFHSQFEMEENKTCPIGKYHPIYNNKMEKCYHDGCKKKLHKSEYVCCHKKIENKENGCLLSEGKHIFKFENIDI